MNRARKIAIMAFAGIIALGIIMNNRNLAVLVPANVVAIKSIVATDGPDEWQVEFELSNSDVFMTEPETARPTFKVGDSICVREHSRGSGRSKYFISFDTSCWSGAVTPLQAPD